MLILLLLSIVSASFNSAVLHKAKLVTRASIYRFNLIGTLVWCVCLPVFGGFKLHLDKDVLLWGCVYGLTQAMFILFKTAAMNSGPVSVTTLVGNSSMLVSVAVCFILWGEPISLYDAVGLALLMLGIVLATAHTASESFTRRWPLYAVLFLVCSAGIGITFKAFSKSSLSDASDMMLTASVVMLAAYAVFCLFSGGFKADASTKHEKRTFVIYALVSGLLSCLYNRLNVYLSGALDGVIFFPSFNGGVIMLSTALGVVLLHERLKPRQLIGIALGIIGICMIGIF